MSVRLFAGAVLCLALVPFAHAADVPTAGFTDSAPAAKPVHLLVGRSMFINTSKRLTRIYVTDPTVLTAYVSSPTQALVTTKMPGISSLVVWDESGASQTYFISSDLDLQKLQNSIQQAMPTEGIKASSDGGRIVLSGEVGTASSSDAAARLATLYSKDVFNAIVVNSARLRQIKLKVRILEVDRSKLTQFGFNFLNAGGNMIAQSTTAQFPSQLGVTTSGSSASTSGTSLSVGSKTLSVADPLNFLLYSASLNVGATIQDLEQKQVLQILAEPTITAISGQKASFLSGGEFPFPVVQGLSGGYTSISIQFRPYGVKLDFTPQVNIDGSIALTVAPEVSALDYTNAVSIDGYEIPALSTRRAETQVVLKSGQSFAISGLLDRRTTDQFAKTPGISSIPILGELFKSKSINHALTDLIVVVTPEIVDPGLQPGTEHEPVMPVPSLDPKTFDSALPKSK